MWAFIIHCKVVLLSLFQWTIFNLKPTSVVLTRLTTMEVFCPLWHHFLSCVLLCFRISSSALFTSTLRFYSSSRWHLRPFTYYNYHYMHHLMELPILPATEAWGKSRNSTTFLGKPSLDDKVPASSGFWQSSSCWNLEFKQVSLCMNFIFISIHHWSKCKYPALFLLCCLFYPTTTFLLYFLLLNLIWYFLC